MKAVVYNKATEFGLAFSASVIKPALARGQVLVKAKAASINPVDLKLQEFYGVCWMLQGKSVGLDLAGEVVEVASDVASFKPGDAVWGFGKGTLAEYVACPANELSAKPQALSFSEAAALPTVAITALQGFKRNRLQPGQRVLIIGASGGVGTAAVQVAKAMGAHVTGICGTDNVSLVRSLGADDVIDYRTQDVSKLCSGGGPGAVRGPAAGQSGQPREPFDLIYDTVSSREDMDYEAVLRSSCLKPGGRYVCINSPHVSDFVRMALADSTGLNLQRQGYDLYMAQHKAEDLEQLAQWVQEGKLRPVLHGGRTFAMTAEGVHEAFALLKSRRAKGKIVINIS